jgi:hypothetical protein
MNVYVYVYMHICNQKTEHLVASARRERVTEHSNGNLRLYISDAKGRVSASEQRAQHVIAAEAGQAVVLPLESFSSGALHTGHTRALLWSIDEVIPAHDKLVQETGVPVRAGGGDDSKVESDSPVFIVARASWYAAGCAVGTREGGEGGADEGSEREHGGGTSDDAECADCVEGDEHIQDEEEERGFGARHHVARGSQEAEEEGQVDQESHEEEEEEQLQGVVSPLYLGADTCALIRKRFARDSAVQLQHFLCNATYDSLWREWRQQRWEARGTRSSSQKSCI